jgi:hypothetical protein
MKGRVQKSSTTTELVLTRFIGGTVLERDVPTRHFSKCQGSLPGFY